LSWNVICPAGIVPKTVAIASTRSNGRPLDAIDAARIRPVPCPAGTLAELECGSTEPIRATSDVVDRSHPTSVDDSLKAEVGGRIVLEVEGHKAASIRVGGPRRSSVGALGRFKSRLRFHVVRASAGGAVPVGGDETGAVDVLRAELRTVNALWGQCGIVFGDEDGLELEIVDPPAPHLLAVGCDVGLPASGGRLSFRADGRSITAETRAGQSPVQVASSVAHAARNAGFVARVSTNARISPGALRTADVLVRRRSGALARLSAQKGVPLSDDGTLSACLGVVDLSDGLSHFSDLDAVAGTVEERALIKAYLDDDPATIDVFVVPSFSRTGRIGESFIDADRSSIQNAVVIDRAGIRAGSRSFALAHEIGHILLDMPGHPDDFGIDRPWVLLDADAADPSIFGPRRLPLADWERAVVQSGPASPVPLLEAWPLYEPGGKSTAPSGK
jgi:hypothetical protein